MEEIEIVENTVTESASIVMSVSAKKLVRCNL